MKHKKWVNVMSACILILCVGYAAILIKAYFDGKFDSVESLRQYIEGYGIWAPLALITLQAMQVIVPILPGFLGCAVGAVMFGCMGGFWCNYIGISLGSLIAFLLARHYGRDFVQDLFPKDKYDKFSSWAAHSKSYTALLFAGMILPLFPDDFFCYFSGLTKMTFRKFFWIIVIGKPWCLLAYSYGFSFI